MTRNLIRDDKAKDFRAIFLLRYARNCKQKGLCEKCLCEFDNIRQGEVF